MDRAINSFVSYESNNSITFPFSFCCDGGIDDLLNPASFGIQKQQVGIGFDHSTGDWRTARVTGVYAGFDTEEFTSRAGGKAEAIRYLKARDGFQTLVMVGDGATDMEARQDGGADLFVGFGGVVARPAIVAGADWFVDSFDPLIEGLA